jgi:hypothetical protein
VNVIGTVQPGATPTFALTSYSYSGFVGTDTSSMVVGTLSCTPLAQDNSGFTPISCTGLSAANYIISYSYGASSATPPTLLTVAVNGTVGSGATPAFMVNSLTYSGFINSDTISAVAGTLSCSLGPAQMSVNPISCLGLSASNYNIRYDFTSSPGTVAATPSPLTVNVTGNVSGGEAPTFTPGPSTYSGFVGTDSPSVVSGTLNCQPSAIQDAAGNYPISCSGLTAANYIITYSYSYVPNLIAGQVPLAVAVSGTVPSGASMTAPLTVTSVTYSGFVNNDTISAVSGTLSCTVDTTANPNTLSCTGLSAPVEYTISYWLGTVTVPEP